MIKNYKQHIIVFLSLLVADASLSASDSGKLQASQIPVLRRGSARAILGNERAPSFSALASPVSSTSSVPSSPGPDSPVQSSSAQVRQQCIGCRTGGECRTNKFGWT